MRTIDPEALKIAPWNSKEYRDKTMDVLLTTMLLVHGRHRNFILIIKKGEDNTDWIRVDS